MSKSTTAARATRSTSTKSADHAHERKSDKPCLGCGGPYVHSGGFCSRCYNLARKPKAEGKKGDELVAAVKAKLAEAKPSKAKPAGARKRAPAKAQPVTTEDAVAANAEMYGPGSEQEVTF